MAFGRPIGANDRIAKAERVLGVSLDDPDIRVSLHVALLADDVAAQAAAP